MPLYEGGQQYVGMDRFCKVKQIKMRVLQGVDYFTITLLLQLYGLLNIIKITSEAPLRYL